VRHGGVVNYLTAMAKLPGLSADDVMMAATTLSFDIAVTELLLPLTVGARVELVSRETAGDAALLAAVLESSGATVMQATPATWTMLIEGGWQGRPGLKALCGGEALPRALADKLLSRVGELWNVYGPLGVETLSVFDGFFELGGHSLLLLQVMRRLRDTFKLEIPLRSIYEERTVAALAKKVEELLIEEVRQIS